MELVESLSSSSSTSSSSKKRIIAKYKSKTNMKKYKDTHHPVYRGIRQKISGNKQMSEVRELNKKSRIWLDTFSTPEMTARAYDETMLTLRGETGKLKSLKNVQSSSLIDIQIADPKPDDASFQTLPLSSSTALLDVENGDDQKSRRYTSLIVESLSDEISEFVDEEAMFNMPVLIDSMAEGLLITPPAMKRGFDWDDMQFEDMDLTLWRD